MLSQPSLHVTLRSLFLLHLIVPIPSQALDLPWPPKLTEPRRLSKRESDVSMGKQPQYGDFVHQTPNRMRKMSDDKGEMFFPEYWDFGDVDGNSLEDIVDQESTAPRPPDSLEERDESREWTNASISQPMQAAFALHSSQYLNAQPLLGRFLKSSRNISPLDPRDFSCPGDTTACTSINRPNSCCPTGSGCQIIQDSGSGDVGCCADGQTCGGNVAGCPAGDTSCPDSAGGGCCVPGYACASVGCVLSSTAVTTVQPIVTASPPSSSPPPPSTTPAPPPASPPTSDTSAVVSTSTFTAVTSEISTATAPSSSLTSSSPSPSSTTTPKPTSSTSASAILPIRPTSSVSIPTHTTTAAPLTITASTCPTGFYQCSAYDHLGCCRVGRDCGLTSCPAASSTLAINSNGVTVNVIPSGSADAGCAAGWFSCAAGQGGGCCPSGYACGTSCTATGVVVQGGQTGTATVAKNNEAGRMGVGIALGFLLGGASFIILNTF